MKKTFRLLCVLTGIVVASVIAGENDETIFFQQPADWGGLRESLGQGSDGVMFLRKPGSLVLSTDPIDVDLTAETTFTGEFRREENAPENTLFYYGLLCYDRNMRRINAYHVSPVKNSETRVGADAQAGDKTLQVEDASAFPVNCLLAFDPQPEYADLPNFSVSTKIQVKEVRPLPNGSFELILSSGLEKDVKQGTAIRAHHKGSPYLYAVTAGLKLKNEWTTLSGTLKGDNFGESKKAWYPGTRFASLAIFCGGSSITDDLIAFKNMRCEVRNGTKPTVRKQYNLSDKFDSVQQTIKFTEMPSSIILLWENKARTKLTFSTFSQKFTPSSGDDKEKSKEYSDSGIALSKTGVQLFVLPNLQIQAAKPLAKLLASWDDLPNAFSHIAHLEIVRVTGGAEIWLDGYYGGTVASNSPLEAVSLDQALCQDEGILVNRNRSESHYITLRTNGKNNSGAWQVSDCQVKAEALPVPMEFSAANFDLRQNKADNYADYIRRFAFDNDHNSFLFSVPACFYTSAWVLFAIDDEDATLTPAMSARLTRFAREGRWGGRAITRMAHTAYEFSKENAIQVGTCKANGKTKALYLTQIKLDAGKIQDLLNYDQRGNKTPGQYLDFELTGPLTTIRHPFGDGRMKPDQDKPSALHVFAVTLEKAGAEMFVRPLQPGNIFHNQDIAELAVDFKAIIPGEYRLRWTISNAEGDIVSRGSCLPQADNRISLQQPIPGYYEITIDLLEKEELRISHTASFALLGEDTRQATAAQSPYGSWWFMSAHHVSDDPELIGPLFLKAGLRKSTALRDDNPRYTEAALAKWKLTATTIGGWREAFNLFDNDKDPAATDAKIAAGLKAKKEAFPSANNVMIFHESAKWGYKIAPEVLGFPPTEKEWDGADERFTKAKRYAEIVRRTLPDVRIMLGNSLSCGELLAELFRRNFPQELGDNLGMEVVSRNSLPERQWEGALQACELMQLAAQKYGYNWKPTSCFESNYRLDSLIGDEAQAYLYVRDMLVMHAWNFPDINVALLFDVANNYYHGFWGGSGLCQRVPYLYPKKAYVGVATLTKMLDQGKLLRAVPTGTNSAFALEFARPDGSFAYAFWSARGTTALKLHFKRSLLEKMQNLLGSSKMRLVDFYGRPQKFTGSIAASEAAQYLWSDEQIQEISTESWQCPPEIPLQGFQVAKKVDRVDDWEIVSEVDSDLEAQEGQTWLPCMRKAEAEVRAVQDQEKGLCLELEIKNRQDLPDPYLEYTVLRLKEPVLLPDEPINCGMWVKGNSGWGQIFWEFTDADGKRLLSAGQSAQADISDYEGRRCINFNGWYHIAFPLSTKSSIVPTSTGFGNEWKGDISKLRYPLTLTGIGFAASARALILDQRVPVQQIIRISEITCQ